MAKDKKKKAGTLKTEKHSIRKFTLRDNSGILDQAQNIINRMDCVKKPSLNTYILECIQGYNNKTK